MPGRRNCCKEVFTNIMMKGVKGKKVLYNPVIRSHSFRDPMHLDYKLDKYFWFLLSTLGGRGWQKWVGVEDFPAKRVRL